MPGSRRSPLKHSVSAILLVALLAGGAGSGLQPYRIDGDGIAAPLGGMVGDAGRGRAIVLARAISTCLLCHGGPFPEERFQGSIAPSLTGVGARLTPAQLRLRLVAPAASNPETIMPSFYTVTGLKRVGAAWQGRPILDAGQIEDVVAYLATLRAP